MQAARADGEGGREPACGGPAGARGAGARAGDEPAEPPAPVDRPWVVEKLDAEEAAALSKKAGGKGNLLAPVRCPAIEVRGGAPLSLAASGPLAALMVNVDGFLRADLGFEQAALHLGEPVVCTNLADRELGYHLASKLPNVRATVVSTDDFAVRGISVYFDKPVELDGAALTQRFGAGHERISGPNDKLKDRWFDLDSPDFKATLTVMRSEPDDPSGKMRVSVRALSAGLGGGEPSITREASDARIRVHLPDRTRTRQGVCAGIGSRRGHARTWPPPAIRT